MKRFFRILIIGGIFAFTIALCALLWITKPEAQKSADKTALPVVEYTPVELRSVTFELPSQGIVESDRRVQLASEVAGKVLEVAPQFEVGGEFAEGETMVELDPTDYEAAVAQAASTLANAKSELAAEEARAEQAERDWKNLGRGEASELVLRKPQLESAKQTVASAEAALAKAKQDLARTTIRAPFRSIVSSASSEVGSYLTPGAAVAEVYETSPFEVRLPLSVDEAALVRSDASGDPTGTVEIRATVAGVTRRWKGEIVRNEGEIDRATRSLYLVAKIGEALDTTGVNLRPGLYVEASIPSLERPGVAAVPAEAFRNLEEVVLIEKKTDEIQFRKVDVLYRKKDVVYVAGGLEEGERLCLTELPDLIEGVEVDPRLKPAPPASPDKDTTAAN